MANNLAIAVVGGAGGGKTASLRNIPNQNKWLYINCEVNKPISFPNNFKEIVSTSSKQFMQALATGIKNVKCEGIIIDTFTSVLDMQEMHGKKTAEDGFKAWDAYRDFVLNTFQQYVANCNKPLIVLCHSELGKDARGRSAVQIAVKGSMSNRGIESFFTNIVYADCIDVDELEEYSNDCLTITDDEKADEVKYVFQTRKAGSGVTLPIRQTLNMWKRNEAFIDNDVMLVINRIKQTYKME